MIFANLLALRLFNWCISSKPSLYGLEHVVAIPAEAVTLDRARQGATCYSVDGINIPGHVQYSAYWAL